MSSDVTISQEQRTRPLIYIMALQSQLANKDGHHSSSLVPGAQKHPRLNTFKVFIVLKKAITITHMIMMVVLKKTQTESVL